jgi:hypothetical protein
LLIEGVKNRIRPDPQSAAQTTIQVVFDLLKDAVVSHHGDVVQVIELFVVHDSSFKSVRVIELRYGLQQDFVRLLNQSLDCLLRLSLRAPPAARFLSLPRLLRVLRRLA